MWFTKDSSGFRGWIAVIQSNGEVRTGLLPGDFTVTVVKHDDTASSTPSVAESTEKPGLYYFDISSAFLIANGVGEYGVLVEINTFTGPSSAPNIRTALSETFKVSDKDFNDIPSVATITDIQNGINNIEGIVNDIDIDVSTILRSMISAQFEVIDTSTLSVSHITTDATLPDDIYNGQLVVLVSSVGTTPVILARSIADYIQADGTFVVSPDLPFVPNPGDEIIIVSRTATASVDNNAIANAVWTVATSPTTPGSYGELVNIIGDNSSLIPGLI